MSIAAARTKTVNLVPTILKAGFATAVSKTGNGVAVAAINEQAPTASVSLVINAGSRFDAGDKAGIAHFAKNFGFKNTGKRSGFRIARETELVGGVLSSNLGRETISFTAECLKEDVPYFVEVFGNIVSETKYAEHEFHGVATSVAADCSAAEGSPEVAVVEALHTAAFRNGLGNSLYAAPYSDISTEDLKQFAADNFVANRIALVATGVSQEKLKELANSSFADIASGSAVKTSAAKYFGGDARLASHSEQGHVAVAFEGAAAGTQEFYTAQVLRALLGGDHFIKWSTSGASPLAAVASQTGKDVKVSAFNFGYSDAGLFGIYAQAEHQEVAQVAKSAVDSLKAAAKAVSAEDFKRALSQAKYEAASRYEVRASATEALVAAAFQGKQSTGADVFAAKLLKSKPTTVVLGKTSELPYADALI
ncbi:ubiquinol-cytochrome c reductase core subunit 1 [Lunasporangiospora selenospora]|uniref:Cytochrome b-c1 complex subunit 2, mitochondrial n=1 Tax=Lunasporangiospora selenospora TaxID=979761 RepID=A0A9P6FPF7_9FUNG|nr:ubiquinol-cytochrome c reductase core subunit 1 [Lunasporangiospora selenospora]